MMTLFGTRKAFSADENRTLRLDSLAKTGIARPASSTGGELIVSSISFADALQRHALPVSLPGISVPVEKTPEEFSHLYAAVERVMVTLRPADTDTREATQRRAYVIGVTSAVAGEGKTTVALHLAMCAARNSFYRVCLVDLSLNDGDLCHRMGLSSGGSGIVDLLEGQMTTLWALNARGCADFVLLPSGKAPANPARTARSPRIGEILTSAQAAFDVVLVDLPAVATDNVLPLVGQMDGLIMVARAGVTPRDVINRALDHVGREKVLGVALNRIPATGSRWLRRRS